MVKTIIAIDGGGTRGISSSMFLERIEQNIVKDTGDVLSDHFDGFAGTSIGNIIAAHMALGRSMAEIHSVMTQRSFLDIVFSKHILNKLFGWIPMVKYVIPRYLGAPKSGLVEKMFGTELYMSDVNKNLLLTTYDINNRTFVPWNNFGGWPLDPKLSSLIDASSAAPAFFPSVKIETRTVEGKFPDYMNIPASSIPQEGDYHIDGGLGANSPVSVMYFLMKKRYPDEEIRILSIGNGYQTGAIWHGHETAAGWAGAGLNFSVIDAPNQIYHSEAFLNADNFLRVNLAVPEGISGNADDSSQEGVVAMIQLGNDMFDKFGKETIDFIMAGQ
jgi:patatin-like phospholipase/acyl hydrolase